MQSFDQWTETPEGTECCDLTVFPGLPKKHYPYVLARLQQAYKSGVASATVKQEPLVLTPPPTEGDSEHKMP